MNTLWSAIISYVEAVVEDADGRIIRIFRSFQTVMDFLQILRDCWNQFGLLLVLTFAITMFFLIGWLVALITLLFWQVVVGVILGLLASIGTAGLTREYCQ